MIHQSPVSARSQILLAQTLVLSLSLLNLDKIGICTDRNKNYKLIKFVLVDFTCLLNFFIIGTIRSNVFLQLFTLSFLLFLETLRRQFSNPGGNSLTVFKITHHRYIIGNTNKPQHQIQTMILNFII